MQRSVKFAKFLPSGGWKPVVVAAQPNARSAIDQGTDSSLYAEVPGDLTITRARSFDFSLVYALLHRMHARSLLMTAERVFPTMHVNYKMGWYPSAIRAARRMIAEHGAQVLYSSSPPHSAHLVARRLRRQYGLPWVADFRDAWTQLATYRPPTRVHARLERWLEGGILHHADAIIANTPRNKAAMVEQFGIDVAKVHVIPNGFDPQDFESAPEPTAKSRFVVSCLGNFYAMPDPAVFFQAFRRFTDVHPEAHLRLFGWHARSVRAAAAGFLRAGSWEHSGRVDHPRAVHVMRTSAVLLANVPNEQASHWVPGKLYEYLAAGRPILFIGPPDGDAAEIIRATRTGSVVPNEEAAIFGALEEFHRLWRKDLSAWRPDVAAINRFDRRMQAQYLSQILRNLRDSCPQMPGDWPA
ncbi:MAG TPA: glycosyltransferase [Steroidobacteraceae bacterium]|nr:glycosyltransferase [Steroidobacteraceae bacterium]